MFWKRALSFIVLTPITVLIIYWGTFLYSILIFCVVLLMLVEFSQLSRSIGSKSHRSTLLASGLLFCFSAQLHFSVELAFAVALFGAFADGIFREQDDRVFLSITSTLTGSLYVGWAFGYHLLLLRQMSDADGDPVGRNFVFFLLVILWCEDIAAYLIGSKVGKHKLSPGISPNKTIEGAVAGLLFGTMGGLVFWFVSLQETIGIVHTVILGLLLGFTSQISDLSESVIKRNAHVKDSGSVIPGHGGLLDRCDGLVFSSPVLYYYLQHLVDTV